MANSKPHRKKRKKIFSLNKIIAYTLSLTLILSGSGLILFGGYNNWAISPPKIAPDTQKPITRPVKLYIPKLSKILTVSNGEFVDNRWIVSATGVSYLTSSAPIGANGNSVIYGHNLKNILGDLPTVEIEDKIYVTMDNGDIAKYEVFEKKEILPTQVEILNQSADSRLTIYTCSGFLDQSRFVVIAKLTSNL